MPINSGNGVNAQSTSSDTCHILGSNIQTEMTGYSGKGLFMNFGVPARCNGTVTSWHYCSYNRCSGGSEECDDCDDSDSTDSDSTDDGDNREDYTSIFLVYRKTKISAYERVPGSIKIVTISLRCPEEGGFQCRQERLPQSEQFNIQENDIVAACLMDTNPIHIVATGEESSGSSTQVYHYNANQCTTSQPQTINIDTLQNSTFRLHLYAEIASKYMHAVCAHMSIL